MNFVGEMIIVDHNSDDNTSDILSELQKEYPSLIVDQLKNIEHVQSKVMTDLVNIAANELRADWVFSLNWIEHELVDMEHEKDIFLLNCVS